MSIFLYIAVELHMQVHYVALWLIPFRFCIGFFEPFLFHEQGFYIHDGKLNICSTSWNKPSQTELFNDIRNRKGFTYDAR